jgi:hypothetical protein
MKPSQNINRLELQFLKYMRIAILGWGSLINEPRDLPITGEWQKDGPMLWIEFSRISKRGARAGCLTLVIDERSDEEIRTLYIVSARTDLLQAIGTSTHPCRFE